MIVCFIQVLIYCKLIGRSIDKPIIVILIDEFHRFWKFVNYYHFKKNIDFNFVFCYMNHESLDDGKTIPSFPVSFFNDGKQTNYIFGSLASLNFNLVKQHCTQNFFASFSVENGLKSI